MIINVKNDEMLGRTVEKELYFELYNRLKEKDKEIERLKDLIRSLFYRDYKHELNEEQLELLDNIVFGSIDKENI